MRRPGLDDYHYSTETVPVGAVNQLLDLAAAVSADNPRPYIGPPHYLKLETDVDITVRINSETADEIPVTAADGLVIKAEAQLNIRQLYFSHIGSSSASGDATVPVLAI